LAFEEVTGKDLNWFWNQWYYGSGHPKLKINYAFDSAKNMADVIIEQTQKSGKLFSLPIAIDVYENGKSKRYMVTAANSSDTFHFAVSGKPEWISVDADKILLAEKTDNKTVDNYIAQWKYGKNYLDRKEALDYFGKNELEQLKLGLGDPFFKLRIAAIQKIGTTSYKKDSVVIGEIENLAKNDKNRKVKAAAIQFLVKNGGKQFLPVYEKAITDSSYNVAGAAFKGIIALQPDRAYGLAKQYANDAKGVLGEEIIKVLINEGTEADFEFISKTFSETPMSQAKFSMADKFGDFLIKLNDLKNVKKGIDQMVALRNMLPAQYRKFVDPGFKKTFDKIIKAKGKEIEAYVNTVFK
jgi:aminopeptidase N